MLGLVSVSEVITRRWKFQAFGECLHNVAQIGNEFLTDFWQETVGKYGLCPKQEDKCVKNARKAGANLLQYASYCVG